MIAGDPQLAEKYPMYARKWDCPCGRVAVCVVNEEAARDYKPGPLTPTS